MNWLQRILFKIKTGDSIEVINNGEPVEEYVVEFKGYFIHVLEGDDGLSLAWTTNPAMFDVPIRDYWQAEPPQAEVCYER